MSKSSWIYVWVSNKGWPTIAYSDRDEALKQLVAREPGVTFKTDDASITYAHVGRARIGILHSVKLDPQS